MKKHLFYSLLMLISLMGCNAAKANPETEVAEEDEEGLPVINLSENIKEVSALNLSDAAERVEIVKLETMDKILLSDISSVQVTDNELFVAARGNILRFSHDGKYLNSIGNKGPGPGEFSSLVGFCIDEKTKEVIVEGSNGILVFDYKGNFLRDAKRELPEKLFDGTQHQLVVYQGNYLVCRNLPIFNVFHPEDLLWSVAVTDSEFNMQKLFKNPSHLGKEDEILSDENLGHNTGWYNYWTEIPTSVDYSNDEITFKLPDTDTIYTYDSAKQVLKPRYAIYTREEKGDYKLIHQWVKERKAFDYFSIDGYYSTASSIYFIADKNEQIYTYHYNKHNGAVQRVQRKGELRENGGIFVLQFGRPHLRLNRYFILTNDITGGDFKVDFRSQGKYWIQVLEVGDSSYEEFVENLKTSPTAPQKQQLLDVIARTGEEDNPILLIAVLK